MKHLILLLSLLLSQLTYSQKITFDTSIIVVGGSTDYITMSQKDSSIKIVGDTMKAIRSTLTFILKYSKLETAVRCSHPYVTTTLMACFDKPCNTCTCTQCGYKWSCY